MAAKRKINPAQNAQAVKRLRVAILGGGSLTSSYYLPALKQCPEIELLAVVDPSAQSATELRNADYHGAFFRQTSDEFLGNAGLLAELQLDAVVVAVPNFLHESATCKALEQGLHVLCEKPLTLSELSCRKIAKVSQKTGKMVAVGMVRRLLFSVSLAKMVLVKKLIGDVGEVIAEEGGPYGWTSTSGVFFDRRSGGLLADMGVHYLDILETLLGPLTPTAYQDDNLGGCTADLDYRLKTKDGIPVRLTMSRYRKLSDKITVRGSLGDLVLKKGAFDRVWLRVKGKTAVCLSATVGSSENVSDSPQSDLTPYFTQQFSGFVQSIRTAGQPLATVDEATRIIRLLEWAEKNRKAPTKQTDDLRPTIAPSQVTITGATGFIGNHLAERLTRLGAEIVAPVRNYRTCASLARLPVQMPRFDILDYKNVLQVTKGSRFVFHLAVGNDARDAAKVIVQGTKNCVEAAIANGAECVVVLSSMYVFGQENHSTIDENSPYRPTGGTYGKAKAKMEKWCLTRARTSGKTRIVVLTPSFVYGPEGKAFSLLPVQLARENQFCWVESGEGSANYVYVENLIDACLLAVKNEKAHGQRFLINDGECTWKEFLSPILGDLAKTVPNLTIDEINQRAKAARPNRRVLAAQLFRSPQFRLFIKSLPLFGTAKTLAKFFGSRFQPGSGGASRRVDRIGHRSDISPACPPSWLPELFRPATVQVSSEKAKRVLGWVPLIGLEDGQSKTLAWLEWHGEFLRK